MELKVIGHTKDLRTDTYVVYALIGINDYLMLVGENYNQFAIQRGEAKHKAYLRMSDDIKKGAVLPPITLAVKQNKIDKVVELLEKKDINGVETALSSPNQVFILDGLQRTRILEKLKIENAEFKPNQTIMLEFWLEKETKNLIYRIIILNAGRKPMSLRHQVELLFGTVYEELKKEFPELTLNREVDKTRRTGAKEYTFDSVVTSYHCFLTKNYEPSKENLITQQLQEESTVYSSEDELNQKFLLFKRYFSLFLMLDDITFKKYDNPRWKTLDDVTSKKQDSISRNWWSKENVMNAFFSLLASFGNGNEKKQENIIKSLEKLINDFPTLDDPLGLEVLEEVTKGINPNRKNIGLTTKKYISDGFKDFLYNDGEKLLGDCWKDNATD